MTAGQGQGRIQSVHDLRGIAALSVLIFHVAGTPYAAPPRPLADIATLGQYGVTAFFVISGFVLPYSLARSGYRLRDFGGFLGRRFVRVEPPYFVTIAAAMALSVLIGLVHQTPFHPDWLQLALHVAYLAPLFGKPWVLSVFWTLCVEFQFYLVIGLLYPVLLRWPLLLAVACAACMLLAVPAWFPAEQLPLGRRENIMVHLPVFMVGMALFLRRERQIAPRTFWAVIVLSLAAITLKTPVAAIGATLVAMAVIGTTRYSHRILAFFGDISYSLYLVHMLVILSVLPLLKSVALGWATMMVFAILVSIAAATVLWWVVERPAIRLSKHLGRRRSRGHTLA